MEKTNQTQTQSLINLLFISLAFLMPVFFLPVTTEFFEFNKLALLTVLTVVVLILWGANVIISKKVVIAKSPVDTALAMLTIVVILSTIFSVNKVTSVYGSQGRWFPSLIGVGALVAFYYTAASNVKSKDLIKTILLAFIVGSTITSTITILNYYGMHLGSQPYFQVKNFTPTGSIGTTGLLAITSILMGLFMYLRENLRLRIALGISIVINFFFLALANLIDLWILLAIGAGMFIYFVPSAEIKEKRVNLLALKGVLVAIVILVYFPMTRGFVTSGRFPKEVKLPIRDSWVVVSSAIRDFPVLGTGPSTFQLNFPRYKPVSLNNTDYWNVRFDKPYNEVFNIIGTLGIVGIIVTLIFVYKLVKYILATRNINELSPIIAIGLLVTLTSFLFTYTTVLTGFVLFMLLALSTANNSLALQDSAFGQAYATITSIAGVTSIGSVDTNKSVMRVVLSSPMFFTALAGLYVMYIIYPSEYFMRKSIEAASKDDGTSTYQYQAAAINHFPRRDVYHNAYTQTNLALATSLASRGQSLTDEEKQTVQTLIAQAVRNAKITTEILNPLNVSSWEIRANTYKTLMGVAQNADQWTVAAFTTAIQLDPSNPRLRVDLGGVYYALGDYLSAANMFRQATNLKPDYANAYYNFAQALINLEQYDNAKRALEITQTLVVPNSPDYNLVANDLDRLASLPAVAGAASNKPTVEELVNEEVVEEEVTEQEPIVNEGEEAIKESTASEVLIEENEQP